MKLNEYMILAISFLMVCGSYFMMQQSQPKDPNTFIVGTAAGYAPWVSVNEQGEYEGFDVDVMRALAEKMGKKLVIKDLGSMPSLFIALEQKKIDCIIWGISITQDRLQRMAMVRYQGDAITSYPLLFWQAIPEGISSITDMNGARICVEPASSQEGVLDAYPLINKIPVEKVDDALLQIQYGKADAALVEPAIAKKFAARYSGIKMLDIPLKPEQQVQGVGICLRSGNAPLIDEVTRAVNSLIESSEITALEQKWNIS